MPKKEILKLIHELAMEYQDNPAIRNRLTKLALKIVNYKRYPQN